jgi:chromosome segregation ATPase
MDRAQIEREIAVLEEQLATLQWTESHGRSSLAALEEQLADLSNQIAAARNIEAEREQQLERARIELSDARRADEYRERLAAADAAARALGNAIENVLAAINAYGEARASAAESRAQLPQAAVSEAPPEPPEAAAHEAVAEHWATLLAAVGARREEELEDDLVEAAARSAMGHAIPNLPAHLRPLARRRREEYLSKLARSGRPSEAG